MIKLEKNTTNDVVVTLTEKTTISNPTYLFSFKNDITNEYKNFIAADTSTATDRYNEFSIVEVGNGAEDLLNGEISLTEYGFYTYTIYAQTSPTNLIPANADETVEIGKMKLIGNEVSWTEPTNDNDDTYIVLQDE